MVDLTKNINSNMLSLNTMKDFGKTLKDLRTKRGVSLKQAAKELRINKSSLFSYESEGAFPQDPQTLLKLSNYYGISIDSIIRGENDTFWLLARAMEAFHNYFCALNNNKNFNKESD